uniref:Serine esterase (DUF676) n=1 Tax=Candidatus Kentrum sp. LFY TaxID=2126342 RepID=A0A450UPS9_9GAMM|nr:MAG: Putative serine esterase (DUF676) [Candidatus Kentron sp. LFY]
MRADVVFVHGLGGDAFKTWCHDEENLHDSWPYWLAEEFPKVCVWSLDYAASPVKSGILGTLISKATRGRIESGQAMSLPEQATEVLEELVRNKLGEYPILFICHSLGGLLAKQLLLKAYDASNEEKHAIFEKTRSVLFLATPHMGAALASLARALKRIFSTTVSIKALEAYTDQPLDLYGWYRNHSEKAGIHTKTYYEGHDTSGIRIVVRASSHPGVGEEPIALSENHLSIAKPAHQNSLVYNAACDLLRKHILGPETTHEILESSRDDKRRNGDTPPFGNADEFPDDSRERSERREAMLPRIEEILGASPDVHKALCEVIGKKETETFPEGRELANYLLDLQDAPRLNCLEDTFRHLCRAGKTEAAKKAVRLALVCLPAVLDAPALIEALHEARGSGAGIIPTPFATLLPLAMAIHAAGRGEAEFSLTGNRLRSERQFGFGVETGIDEDMSASRATAKRIMVNRFGETIQDFPDNDEPTQEQIKLVADELEFIRKEYGIVYYHPVSEGEAPDLRNWARDLLTAFPDFFLLRTKDDRDQRRREIGRYRMLVDMIKTYLGDDEACRRLQQQYEGKHE